MQDTVEFKDEEETVTTKSIQITQATETTTTTTRKRSGAASSKTLDLGAAANYTGDNSPEEMVCAHPLFPPVAHNLMLCMSLISVFLPFSRRSDSLPAVVSRTCS